jgi:hypothetical protein
LPEVSEHARNKRLQSRQQELLPVTYSHVVFSVPHRLVPLIWQNKQTLFALLFEASAATLLEVAAYRGNILVTSITTTSEYNLLAAPARANAHDDPSAFYDGPR